MMAKSGRAGIIQHRQDVRNAEGDFRNRFPKSYSVTRAPREKLEKSIPENLDASALSKVKFLLPAGFSTIPKHAEVAEWQTRVVQDHVPARVWRFDSSLRHFLLFFIQTYKKRGARVILHAPPLRGWLFRSYLQVAELDYPPATIPNRAGSVPFIRKVYWLV